MNKSLLTLSIILVVFISLYSSVRAANFSVATETNLVAAINTANVNGEADTINLSGNIILTNVLPDILADGGNALTINGNGFTLSRSGAAPDFRILTVRAGANLTMHAITISNGVSNTHGGAIFNQGIITLNSSTLSGNTSTDNGGAIHNAGTLTLNNCNLSGNSSIDHGGAIFNDSNYPLTINNSNLLRNSSLRTGGAIFNSGILTINNSTLSGNSANFESGAINNNNILNINNSTLSGNSTNLRGGVFHNNFNAIVIISNSTLSDNTANLDGGAIDNRGTVFIYDSTLSGNSAVQDGGAIYHLATGATTTTIINSTLSGNSANRNGGGIWNFDTVTLNNSIIANSVSGGDFSGNPATVSGMNIIEDGSIPAGVNVLNVDPGLGALADNGGPTQTHALLAGSPAIDNSGGGATASDQRGAPAFNTRDIGAYESNGVFPSLSFTLDETTLTEGGAITQATVTVTVQNYFTNFDVYFQFPGISDNSDYTTSYPGLYTITGNGDTSFTIDIVDDVLIEGTENLNLQMLVIGTVDNQSLLSQQIMFNDNDFSVVQATPIENAPEPEIGVFDPAISKLGFLLPGEIGVTGETLEWVVTVSNTGAVSGNNVTVTDTLIDALQINSVDAPGGTVTINGQTVTVVYPTLNVGEAVQFSIFTTVLDGVEVNNTACVTADNQSVEECATGGALRELPQTGETSVWHNWILLFSGLMILLSGGLLFIRYRHPVQ